MSQSHSITLQGCCWLLKREYFEFYFVGKKKKPKKKKNHNQKTHHPTNVELENRTTKTLDLSPMLTFFWIVLQNLIQPEDTAGTRRRNTRNCRVKLTSEVATPFPAFLLLQHTL